MSVSRPAGGRARPPPRDRSCNPATFPPRILRRRVRTRSSTARPFLTDRCRAIAKGTLAALPTCPPSAAAIGWQRTPPAWSINLDSGAGKLRRADHCGRLGSACPYPNANKYSIAKQRKTARMFTRRQKNNAVVGGIVIRASSKNS